MQHFFVEPGQIQGTIIQITGNDVNHIRNVLRMKIGEEISVRNGIDGKEYRAEIAAFEEDAVWCDLRFVKEEGIELPAQIFLFQGLPKADKMELIIQKAVELGVHEVIPVATKRAVVKLDEKREKSKIARWNGISESAAKQSGRAIVPQIHEVMTMKEAIAYASAMEAKAIPYELAEGMEATKSWISDCKTAKQIAVFIGPEGGFAPEEIAMAEEAGVVPISLGKRILRTETAGLTVLSILMYELEMSQV